MYIISIIVFSINERNLFMEIDIVREKDYLFDVAIVRFYALNYLL